MIVISSATFSSLFKLIDRKNFSLSHRMLFVSKNRDSFGLACPKLGYFCIFAAGSWRVWKKCEMYISYPYLKDINAKKICAEKSMLHNINSLYLHRVFHGIRFKVNN